MGNFYWILLKIYVIKKCERTAKLLKFRSDFRKKEVYSKPVTKTLYWNKVLVSEWVFKLVCHCESCRLSEIGCVKETLLKHLLTDCYCCLS